MSSRMLLAPFEEAAVIGSGYRGPPEGRTRYIQTSVAQLQRICRSPAQITETVRYLLQEADRLLAGAANGDVSPAAVLVAILIELSKSPTTLKDAADLLWRSAERITPPQVPFVTAVFYRVAALGPSDAFSAVVERIIRTFSSGTEMPYAKKLLAVHLVEPITELHPNLFLTRLHPFFGGAWTVAKDLMEGDGGRGAPRLKEAFARAVDLLRRVATSFPAIVAELHDRLRSHLKSRRDTDIAIGVAFMEPIITLRTPTTLPIPYSELWSVLWPLRDREALRFQLMSAFVSLARYDPISFTVDRRSDRERQDPSSSRQDHRNLVMDFVEDLWKRDASPDTSKQVLKFYLKLIAVKFPRDTSFTEHQIDAYFLSTIRFKLVSRTASFASKAAVAVAQHPLEGCWDLLTLLSTICRMFPLSQTIMDAQVAPCIIKILEWGKLAPEMSETLPGMIRCFSPALAERVLTLLLDIVSKTLSGRPFRPSTAALPPSAMTPRDGHSALRLAANIADKLNPVALFAHLGHGGRPVNSDDTEEERDRIVVALRTLATFGISESEVMGDFILQTLLPLLSHDSARVRHEVIRTIAILAVPGWKPDLSAEADVETPAKSSRSSSFANFGSFGSQVAPGVLALSPPASPLSMGRSMAVGSEAPPAPETITATRVNIIRQIIDALLATATADPEHTVRSACLTVVSDTLLPFVSDGTSLRHVFQAIVDSDYDVRLVAQRLLCLLEPRHQALVAPSLRRSLVACFNRLMRKDLPKINPEDAVNSMQTLSILLRHCPRLCEVYHPNVSKILFLVRDYARPPVPNDAFASAIVGCMSALTVGAGFAIGAETAEMMLEVLTALHGESVPSGIRCEALVGLSELVTHAPIDVASPKYRASAKIRIQSVRGILQSSDSPVELRMAALRSLGAVGAIDPELLQRAFDRKSSDATADAAATADDAPREDTEKAVAAMLLRGLGRLIVSSMGHQDHSQVLRLHLRTLMALIDGSRAADAQYCFVVGPLITVLTGDLDNDRGELPAMFFTTAYQLIRCIAVDLCVHDRAQTASRAASKLAAGGSDHANRPGTQKPNLPFDAIITIVRRLWMHSDQNVRLCAVALTCVIVASPSANAEFSVHFRNLVPALVDTTHVRAASSEAMVGPTLEVLAHITPHLPQFRMHIITWLRAHFSRPSLTPECAAALTRFVRYLCHSGVHLREYAAAVVRPMLEVLVKFSGHEDFVHEVFGVFAAVAKQIHVDFAPFAEAIPNEILARDKPATIRIYRRLWTAIGRSHRRGAPASVRNRWREIDTSMPASEVVDFFDGLARRSHKLMKATLTWGESDAPTFLPRDLLDPDRPASDRGETVLEAEAERSIATVASVPEGTAAYLHTFMAAFIENSPYSVLRAISEPRSDQSAAIVRFMFYQAFRAIWRRCGTDLRKVVSLGLSDLLERTLSDDQALLLLGLAEYMKVAGDALLIEPPILASVALRYEAAAKALHWEEESFMAERDASHAGGGDVSNLVRHAEELIMIYGKVNSSASAIGLLNVLKLPDDVKRVLTEESLINLRRYEEALAVKQRPEASPRPRGMSQLSQLSDGQPRLRVSLPSPHHARVRSGSSIMDQSFAMAGTALVEDHSRMKCHYMLGQLNAVLAVRLPPEQTEEEETASQMVRLAADAAMSLGEWSAVERTLANPHFVKESVPYCVAACALAIHRHRWTDALDFVEKGRRLLLDEVGSLLGESYMRAYESVVVAQQLVELEETIEVLSRKTQEERDTTRARVEALWTRRLQLISRDVPTWRRILMTRRLLVPPSRDIANRLKFAELCSEELMPQLRSAAIVEIVGRSPSIDELAHGMLDARVAAKYAEYLLRDGKFADRESEIALLDSMIATYSVVPDAKEVVARLCGLRCSRDHEHLSPRVMELTELATQLDPVSNAAWRDWATMQTRLVENGNQRAIAPALKGYMEAISLTQNSAAVVQDMLMILALWSTHASSDSMTAFETHLPQLPSSAWCRVVPQLIAKIDFGPDRSCLLAAKVILSVFQEHPNDVIFPVLLAASASGRRERIGRMLLDRFAETQPKLVADGRMVSTELCRVAKEAWNTAIFAAWEMYTAYNNAPSRVGRARLIEQLSAFHAQVSAPSTTAESGFLMRNGQLLTSARASIEAWTADGSNDAPLHAAFQCYEAIYRNSANKVTGKTMDLQFWSPLLFTAQNLDVAVPSHVDSNDGLVGISRFVPTVGVITSKQAPRKMQIVGSNGATYSFLVKGGEDLRLDERVMQLFDLINVLLATHKSPSVLSGLNIQRYSVTPISSTVGLCGWVDECDTLHELISGDRDSRGIARAPSLEFVLRGHVLPGDPTAPGFNQDCTRLSLMQQIEVFEYVCDATTGDDLRRAMWARGAHNSEHWLQKRLLYMQSLALMSMAGYILGLGDRHVTNIMIQRTSGKVVHIDFGDCFEVAMTRPSIPEKVPFRLTRMLRTAMDAAQIEGHFRFTSEHVMTVLRDNRTSVMSMLEAFLDDPLVQWRIVNQQQQEVTKDVDHENVVRTVTPEGVLVAAPTTPGGNNNNHADKDEEKDNGLCDMSDEGVRVIRRIKAKLRGRDFGSRKLDPPQQVARLIREATDTSNLAQAWVGWHPWW
jgi:FKBP12-rapamycin complex-associated protein